MGWRLNLLGAGFASFAAGFGYLALTPVPASIPDNPAPVAAPRETNKDFVSASPGAGNITGAYYPGTTTGAAVAPVAATVCDAALARKITESALKSKVLVAPVQIALAAALVRVNEPKFSNLSYDQKRTLVYFAICNIDRDPETQNAIVVSDQRNKAIWTYKQRELTEMR